MKRFITLLMGLCVVVAGMSSTMASGAFLGTEDDRASGIFNPLMGAVFSESTLEMPLDLTPIVVKEGEMVGLWHSPLFSSEPCDTVRLNAIVGGMTNLLAESTTADVLAWSSREIGVHSFELVFLKDGAEVGVRRMGSVEVWNDPLVLDRVDVPLRQLLPTACGLVSHITLADGMTEIPDGFFEGCTNLVSVTLPQGLTNIAVSAFRGCEKIRSVVFGSLPQVRGIELVEGSSWIVEDETLRGVPVYRSNAIGDSQSTELAFDIPAGMTNLVFSWKVGSESGYDKLAWYLDGVKKADISGSQDWRAVTNALDGAAHRVKFVYSKDGSQSTVPDCGWVSVESPVGAITLRDLFPDAYTWLTEVALGAGVTSLPDGFFEDCSGLESIVAPIALDEVLVGGGLDDTLLAKVVWTDAATGGNAGWSHDRGTRHSGVASWRSGAVTHNQESWLEMTVDYPGRLSFWWKASSESDGANVYDYAYLSVDGVAKGVRDEDSYQLEGDAIGGKTDWINVVVDVAGSGPHTIRWTYCKDDVDEADTGDDCVWVDDISWTPRVSIVYDGAGADGVAPPGTSVLAGTTLTLPDAMFRENHTFVGWSDGSATYGAGSAYVVGERDVSLTAVWSPNTLTPPVISSADVVNGGTTEAGFAIILMSAEAGAEIRYTMDGSEPTASSPRYTAPFVADGLSVTIRAIAMRDNYFDSEVAVFSFTRRPYSLSECLGLDGATVTTGGDSSWGRVLGDEAYDGIAALRSGALGDSQTNWVQVVVSGPGTVSFRWKVSCEGVNRGKRRDGCVFSVDGVEAAYSDGTTNGWTRVTVEVPEPGAHTLRWAYGKNGNGTFAGDDCAWLAEVVWTQASVPHWSIAYENLKGATNPNPDKYYKGYGVTFQPLSDVTGYTFTGWTPAAITAGMTGAQTVLANWRANAYRIVYAANGGTGETAPTDCAYDADAAVAEGAFVREGYIFRGWATEEGGGVVYAPGAAVRNLTPADGTVFRTASCTVTITCATKGATIYCTTNGRTPRPTEANRYTGPFEVSGTTTVVAYAVRGSMSSDYVEATLTYVEPEPLTLENALDERKLAGVATGGDAAWTPVEDAAAKTGESVARSGAIGMEQSTWLEATVHGRGTLTFWWKTSCEPDPRGHYTYDHVTFAADGEDRAKLDGETDWRQVSVTFGTDGAHTLRWTYSTDDSDEASDYRDCAWVDGVSWTGSAVPAQAVPGIVGDADATVTGDAEAGFTVTPSAESGSVEVSVPDGLDAAKVTVRVPPTVRTVKPHGAKVAVVRDGHDITAYLDIPAADADGAVDLASATVRADVAREPLDPDRGAVVDLGDASAPSITTAPTKPGLRYTLREGATLDAMADGETKVGDGQPWTPAVTVKGGASGFYTIRVEK